MDKEQEKWAIFWCDLLSPVIYEEIEPQLTNRFLKQLAQKKFRYPAGRFGKPSLSTLRRKFNRYRQGGFDTLARKRRSDRGKPRNQAETDLLSLIRNEYARADDEGRTLIQSALKSSGNIEVNGNELRITLNPLSSPQRSKAIKALCEQLNTTNTVLPDTKLRLVYDVKEHGHVT